MRWVAGTTAACCLVLGGVFVGAQIYEQEPAAQVTTPQRVTIAAATGPSDATTVVDVTPTTVPEPATTAPPVTAPPVTVTVPVQGPTVVVVPQSCVDVVAIGEQVRSAILNRMLSIWLDLTAYLETLHADSTYGQVYPKIVETYNQFLGTSQELRAVEGAWQAAVAGCR